MKNPKVSVVIPAYNHERYVGEAIQSVLDQTFQDLELIIINDGSTDNTETEILKFKDERIRYFSQENRGLSATLNRGIELAQGEYFNFLPSDDAFYPEKIEIQLKIFEGDTGLGLVFAYPQLVDTEGREIEEDPAAQWAIVPYETKEEIFPALFERNFLSAPAALIKMDCFKKVGFFEESLKYAQDYDMWMKVLKHYDIRLLKKPLVRYRWHGENLTWAPTLETERERAKLLLKAYWHLSIKEIFPSLALLKEIDHPRDFARAYHRLAGFLKKSGLEEMKPFLEICEETAKGLENLTPSGGRDLGQLSDPAKFIQGGKKINVLMETRSLDRGGLEEVIYNIARHLDRDLFSLVIVCTDRGGFAAERCRRIGIPVEILKDEKEREYREILSRYDIDLLVTHYSTFGVDIVTKMKIPVVSFLHNIYCWVPDDVLGEMKRVDQKIDRYIAVSEDVKNYSAYRFNISPEKIATVPNGIDLDRLEEKQDLSILRRADVGLGTADYIFLNIASLTPAKAHLLILATLKEVIAEHPEVKVLCVGEILDHEYGEFVKAQIAAYGLERHIRLVEFVEDVRPYYKMADAFLLPSIIEGWSLSMMEAMANGLPLILTKVGGATQVVENNDIGLLVDNRYPDVFGIDISALENYRNELPPNIPSLKRAMLRFLEEKVYWKEAGLKGKRKVADQFDIRIIVNRYEALFHSVVALNAKAVKNKLSDQRDALLRERNLLLAAQERLSAELDHLSAERRQFLNVQEGLDKQISQGLQERREEIGELRHLIESRYQQLDRRIEYVLLRLSLKERLKERFLKTRRFVKRVMPKPMKNKLKLIYGWFNPKMKNKVTWKDESPIYNNNQHYEYLRHHLHALFEPKEIKSSHMTVMNQLLSKEYKGIVIYPPVINWETPLFQRPHQIMRVLAENGYLCFFCVPNPEQDGVDGLKKVQENLYLCGDIPLLHTFLKNRNLIIWNSLAVYKIFREYFPQALLIYDYIDELNVFYGYSPLMEEDHRILVQTADILLTTATNLFERVRPIREDVLLVPNGVYLDDFKTDIVTPPFDLAHISKDGKPIIGYYGALAEWFDYDLINDLALKCEEYNFIIIGPDYDGSIKNLSKRENLFWLGGKNYKELKYYLHFFDVGIIPFKINQITSSTSPLKLFEYMAGGKPIVTTDLKECRKYRSVYVAKDREDFAQKLALALERKTDPEYLAILNQEAKENTWHVRVEVVLRTLAGSQQASKKKIAKAQSKKPGSRFEELLKKQYGVASLNEVTDPVKRMWLDFALSTVQRGETVKDIISAHIQIRGKRYLDIGCAYGGFLVAFRRAGAEEVVGIDINPALLEYCKALLEDYGMDLNFYEKDILNPVAISSLGTFDIITCNDAVEHVNNPGQALEHIASLLNENGLVYLEIPNKFSSSFIRSDGHYRLFGITLLSKSMADRYFKYFYPDTENDVRYKSLSYYLNKLKSIGLKATVINPLTKDKQRLKEISTMLRACVDHGKNLGIDIPEPLKGSIRKRILRIHELFEDKFELYRNLTQTDPKKAENLAKKLILTFGEDFWTIIVRKQPSQLS